MEMLHLGISRASFREEDLAPAARILAEGGLVAFPTETVYGIGAGLDHGSAVNRLLEVTGSPPDRRLTLHLAHPLEFSRFVREVPPAARRLIHRWWPGPLTIVLKGRDGEVRGYRVPDDPVARALLRLAATPIVGLAAAPTDGPPMSDPANVLKVFGGRVEALVDAGPARHGKLSTLVEFGPQGPAITREGLVPKHAVVQSLRSRVLFVCSGNTCRSPMAEGLLRRVLALRFGVPEDRVEERGWVAQSAGVSAESGAPMSPDAEATLRELGCHVRPHSSTRLTETAIEEADRIYTMTRAHLERVIAMVPDAVGRARRLDQARDIEDPIGGGIEAYRAAARHIKKAIEGVVKAL